MTEKQVAGTRYSGIVRGWLYDGNKTPSEDDATVGVAVALDSGWGMTLPMIVDDAHKVERGDKITVTVEITRDEQ